MVDNQSAIMLSKTSAHHNRTKHIDKGYHSIRDCIEDRRVVIKHVKIEDQLVDILTKALGRANILELCAGIGAKKECDEKKIKEENVGSDFLPWSMAHACDTAVKHKGEHPMCPNGAQSMVIIALAKRLHAWHAHSIF